MKAVLLLGLGLCSVRLQAETVHLLQTSLLGGQHFFGGAESALAGNINLLYSPTITLSERWTATGIYQGTYRGTKEVADLAGGGTLFQELANSRISGRAIYKVSEQWAIKPMAGFKTELLKETKNEKWTKGLFDYRKADVGVEAEWALSKTQSARIGYNFFGLWFNNYASLESKTDLGRELAGKKTLDSYSHLINAAVEWPAPWGIITGLNASGVLRNYPDQRVLLESGNYSAAKREDISLGTGFMVKRPFHIQDNLGIIANTGLELLDSGSNQNHLDAAQVKFLPDYYDYRDLRVSLGASVLLGKDSKTGKVFSVSFWNLNRKYSDRLAQNVKGAYTADVTKLATNGIAASATWPMGNNGFALKALFSTINQNSNMEYEAVYRYNFNSSNYLLGFSWEL